MTASGYVGVSLIPEAREELQRLSRILAVTRDTDVSLSDAVLIAVEEYYKKSGIIYNGQNFSLIGVPASQLEEVRAANAQAAENGRLSIEATARLQASTISPQNV